MKQQAKNVNAMYDHLSDIITGLQNDEIAIKRAEVISKAIDTAIKAGIGQIRYNSQMGVNDPIPFWQG